MKKRIGVFAGDPHGEYPMNMLKAIFDEGIKRGYDVFAICSYGGHEDNVLYAEGEKGNVCQTDLSVFDGIIVCEDSFDIESIEDELAEVLYRNATCPVVYLRRCREGFYSVQISGRQPMYEMTRHFIEKHGFRDICFMQGPMAFLDSQVRYQGYIDAMEEAGIPVSEHMVYEGDYWRYRGKQAVDWFMADRDSYPQAIICANDYMALAVCEELKQRGLRVPEDVCISGFDNTMEARCNNPSISSVAVHFDLVGKKGVEIIDNLYNGIPQQEVALVDSELMLYKSCGCGEQVKIEDWQGDQEKLYRWNRNTRRLTFMAVECQDSYEEEEYLRLIAKYFSDTNASRGYLCLCTNEQQDELGKDGAYTSEMILRRIFEQSGEVTICNERFERKHLLPPAVLDQEPPQGYVMLSIHYKNKYFGYMILTFDKDQWIDGYAQNYLSNIANVIYAAELQEKISGLEEIRSLYLLDTLTGIDNRRGFEKKLRALYDQRYELGKNLYVVSIDMDGLKYINDTFGHSEGDKALCALADILKTLIESEESCARVGGDEFSVILLSEGMERDQDFIGDFERALAEYNSDKKRLYDLSASVGSCCISKESELTLIGCLQKADREMYAWKKRAKMRK